LLILITFVVNAKNISMNAHVMCQRNTLNYLAVWLKRFRKRKGYGVHSPAAFYLIRFVFFEKAVYYDYERLMTVVRKAREHFDKYVVHLRLYKLLFRLVNNAQPTSIIEVGRVIGLTTVYLAAPCKNVSVVSMDVKRNKNLSEFTSLMLKQYAPNVELHEGAVVSCLDEVLLRMQKEERLFVLFRPELFEIEAAVLIFKKLIKATNSQSVIVMTGIHANKALNRLWKDYIKSDKISVTFDLYELGVMYFDHSYAKQNYLINF